MTTPPEVAQAPIKLPKIFGIRNLDEVFAVCAQVRASDGPLTLDGSDVEFFDPFGIAILGALLEPISAHRSIRLEWLPVSLGSYLDRMDVLKRCSIEGVESRSTVRNPLSSSLVELTRVSHEREVDQAANSLATAVAGKLTTEDPQGEPDATSGLNRFETFRNPLRYALSELLLNALSHSKREGRGDAAVWVAAQFYPGAGTVQVAVVDNGCGLLATLMHSAKLTEKTHLAAIPTALKPFVSCNPDLGMPGGTANRGVGLTTTHRIARAARGGLVIVSGDAVARADGRVQSFPLRGGASWQGVAISMTCRRSALPSVNIPQLLPPLDGAPTIKLQFG
jgi:hypothetical protein